jgi:hypothetical protein
MVDDVLANWNNLNAAVASADEQQCVDLLDAETKGKARRVFLLRIHSRLNKVRADRERLEITKIAKTKERV